MSSHRRTPRPESATKGRLCRYVVHHKARAEERRLIRKAMETAEVELWCDEHGICDIPGGPYPSDYVIDEDADYYDGPEDWEWPGADEGSNA